MKRKILIFSCIFILFFVTNFLCYQLGIKSKQDEKCIEQLDYNSGQTFYATIKEINDNTILVEGLEVNDINYRSLFSITIDDSTGLEWRYSNIKKSDLKVDQNIAITFTGGILESYPAIINKIVKIQVLDDEI